ncbi:mitochondrial carrier domain-containing protein [Helicostylum pulchrum]|nr:mitochondrial carrier domain-containing protein [Helicostylum pulchrum]
MDQFKTHFISGATGLSLSYACMHPLDTIKTRIQADTTGNWRRVVFSKSTLHSLGKGFFVSALGAAGQGGARFGTYEFCKLRMLPNEKNGLTIPVTALSAVIGDLASSVIKVPREVITAKLQIDHYKPNANGVQPNAGYVIRQTLIEEGPKGLFRGFWAIAARDSPFMVILLVSYENFKAFHHRSMKEAFENTREYRLKKHNAVAAGSAFEELEADIPTMRSVVYGGVSGFLAGYLTTPMDVLRTRLIAQKASKQTMSVVQMAQFMVDKACAQPHSSSFKKSVNTYNAFFVGAVPRSVWWFGICGIFFPTYETLKSLMSN